MSEAISEEELAARGFPQQTIEQLRSLPEAERRQIMAQLVDIAELEYRALHAADIPLIRVKPRSARPSPGLRPPPLHPRSDSSPLP